MSEVDASAFQLRSIQRCTEDDDRQRAGTSFPSTTPGLPSTQVLLDVGGGSSRSDGGAAAPPQRYRCPAFIIQRGSTTLRDVLEDALDGAPPSAGAAGTSHADQAVLSLPFLEVWVFEVVCVYLEHFYGLCGWTGGERGGITADGESQRLSSSSSAAAADAETTATPSALRRPLQLGDLYALSSWEHHFVLHCLFGLPWSEIAASGLATEGQWVDAVSGSVPPGTNAAQSSVACVSLPQRQRAWTRLMAVLEAATRLGVGPLQLLCATVAANMTTDLDASGLARLTGGEGPSTQRFVTPFTAEARTRLLQQFPWLSGGQREAPPARQ